MIMGFDIETTGLNPHALDARILTAVAAGRSGYADSIESCAALLRDSKHMIVGHNIVSFDVPYWRVHVGDVNAALFDTRVAYSLLDETGEANSLAALTEKYLGYKLDEGMKSKRSRLADLPLEQVLAYNLEDSKASYGLYYPLKDALEEQGLMTLFRWLMDVVAPPLIDMMVRGVAIDIEHVEREGRQATLDIDRLSYEMNVMANRRPDIPEQFRRDMPPLLNVDSSQQLAEFLYDELQLPVLEETKGGKPSTRAAVIAQLRRTVGNKHKIVGEFLQRLLDYREAKKLVSTYLKPLAGKHLGVDGRIHTTYFLGKGYDGGTVTGRLSSAEPNLQNIPRDKRVKGSFVPTREYRMFEADYAQLELRVAAWYSDERVMLDAFDAGRDIHTATLATIEGREYEEVVAALADGDPFLTENRALVKRVNFGVLYGTGAHKLQELMRDMGQDVSLRETQRVIKRWFEAYPQLSKWITQTQEEAMEFGEVSTPTGRVRHLPDARKSDFRARARALRQAVNFRVQSLASDITLQGVANVASFVSEEPEIGRVLMTVHDSVVGEYRKFPSGALAEGIELAMTTNVNRALKERFGIPQLPLAVDINTDLERWGK